MPTRAHSVVSLFSCTVWCLLGLLMSPAQAHDRGDDFGDKLLLMGTGPEGGSYSPVGRAVCDAVNRRRSDTLVRCVPVASAGSIFNINAVENGSLQLGIAQEDLLHKAFSDPNRKNAARLRVVARLHDSSIGIMVRKAAGISSLADLRRAVVNVGNLGSATSADAQTLLQALDLDSNDLKEATRFTPDAYVKAFCEGRVDVVINSVAHPAGQFSRLRACDGELLPISAPVAQRMMTINPMLRPMVIPAGAYDPAQPPVPTLGIRNLLIARDTVDPEAVFRLVTRLHAELDRLRSQEATMGSVRALQLSDLVDLPAPVHPGTLRVLGAGAL